MKITVRNLGFVKEAEIDLKPLTIFVGPNNSGKSWLVYTLACILGPSGFNAYLKSHEETESPMYPPLEKAVKDVLEKGSATIDMVRFARDYAETYFNNVASQIDQLMPSFMSTNSALFQNLQVSVNLTETKAKLLEHITSFSVNAQIAIQKPLLTVRKKRGDRKLYIYTSSEYASAEYSDAEEQTRESQLPSDIIANFLIRNILQVLQQSLYTNVWILPTERTTFITFPHGTRKSRDGELTLQDKAPSEGFAKALSGPVNYLLNMISHSFSVSLGEVERRTREAKNHPKLRKYNELADILEKQILNGEVKIFQQDVPLQKEISQSAVTSSREVLFQPTKDTSLEISVASSMVKELSPLVLYLRYLAQPNDLLIIDEPEMNLHPEAQVKLIELIAMMVNADLNIVITTHSPYLIDHLTNLIKASEVKDKESVRNEFYLKQLDAFISRDKASVYLVDQGAVTNAIDQEGIIDLDTFGEVSDRISDIYFKL